MCVHGGVFSTTGPYATYCMAWLRFYQGIRRKSGQLSVAAARGQSAWGHAHKAAPELETAGFGLYCRQGARMRKKLRRHW